MRQYQRKLPQSCDRKVHRSPKIVLWHVPHKSHEGTGCVDVLMLCVCSVCVFMSVLCVYLCPFCVCACTYMYVMCVFMSVLCVYCT